MAERTQKVTHWGYAELALKNAVVAEKGGLACINTADAAIEVVAGTASTTLLPIGTFQESFTGNGTRKIQIKLFREIVLHTFDNDPTDAVTAADFGSDCYIYGPSTVGSVATGKSVAGKVWGVSSEGVLVAMKLPV